MRIEVLGVGFDNITKGEAVQEAMSLIDSGGTHYVVTPNPEIVEICRERDDVARAVNGADLVLPDGIGIIKGAAMLGAPLRERVPGIEFAQALMGQLAKTSRSIYFLGGKPGVAVQAAKNLARTYPGLRCAGFRDGYFRDDAPVAEEIRKSGADVVFVCLGAPKQELWMMKNGPATGAKLLCGLGGSLDVFAGTAKRAPDFFCNHGLEWLYRLCKEPWRWKRMMKLPVFLLHVRQEKGKPRRRPPANVFAPDALSALSPDAASVSETLSPIAPDAETQALQGADAQAVQETDETPQPDAETAPEESDRPSRPPLGGDVAARRQRGDNDAQAAPEKQKTEESMSDYQNQDTTRWDAEETPRRRKKRGPGLLGVLAYFFVVIVVSVILASFAWELASDLCAFNRGAVTTHTVEISQGDDLDDVAEKLHNAGLVKHAFFFKLFANVTHAENKIGAGTYALNTDMDYRALVVGMRNTSASLSSGEVKVTIPKAIPCATSAAC